MARGARKGTHGALSKAGKTRSLHRRQFRPEEQSKKGMPFHGKKHLSPRVKNRRKYHIATLCPDCGADINIGDTNCWRCRSKLFYKGTRPVVKERRRGLGRGRRYG